LFADDNIAACNPASPISGKDDFLAGGIEFSALRLKNH